MTNIPMTGRDGAVDYKAKAQFADQVVHDAHTYRVIELVGTSPMSIDDAVRTAVERASKTLRNLRWVEVVRTNGHIQDGKITHFQVTLKVGFTMENPE